MYFNYKIFLNKENSIKDKRKIREFNNTISNLLT